MIIQDASNTRKEKISKIDQSKRNRSLCMFKGKIDVYCITLYFTYNTYNFFDWLFQILIMVISIVIFIPKYSSKYIYNLLLTLLSILIDTNAFIFVNFNLLFLKISLSEYGGELIRNFQEILIISTCTQLHGRGEEGIVLNVGLKRFMNTFVRICFEL